MVKYSDVLELYEYFQPVYDITNERKDYWKQFIPTTPFLDTLKTFLTSIETKEPKNKKSIWLQGKYGVGKSHATGVILHLLWDPLENILDFIEKIKDAQLREKIKAFRKHNRVFPVIIKGSSGINDGKSFSLLIEKSVKDALEKETLDISVNTEFEKYINHIKNSPHIDWNNFIETKEELKALVYDKKGLIEKLSEKDIEVLKVLEESLDYAIPTHNIEDWLIEVLTELRNRKIATALAIYWDEFTPILELRKNSADILSILQNIAEKSFNNNLFLFIVSHRHPLQASTQEDLEKLLGRFHYKNYSMEEITTYHIISNALRKKDKKQWKNIRDANLNKPSLNKLIWRILRSESKDLEKVIKDVFPFHPYTAFLSTKISEYVGSTERSIFKFLYDKEKGFLKFIEEYPKEINGEKEFFLTPDFLWDFFYEDFKREENEKIHAIIDKYNLHIRAIKDVSPSHVAIFKGILLLNILNRYVDIRNPDISDNPYLPSSENIKYMYLGTCYEKDIDNVLNYIDTNGYVSKTPDNLFLVSSSILPIDEVDTQKERLRREYEDIIKAFKLTANEDLIESLKESLKENVLRDVETNIYWAGMEDYEIRRRLNNDFKNPYTVKVALFVAKNLEELNSSLHKMKRLAQEPSFQDIILLVSNEVFDDRIFDKFIEYSAKRIVANNHSYENEEKVNREYIKTTLMRFIDRIKRNYVRVFFKEKKENIDFNALESYLNSISKEIFSYGMENLSSLTGNINIWKTKNSKKAVECFIFAKDRNDLEEKTKNSPYKELREILKTEKGEYIVDVNLKFKNGIYESHPTFRICKEIDKKLKQLEGRSFNLAEELEFLSIAPYGLYLNMVSAAVLSFAMRRFVDRLFEVGTGRKVTNDLMRSKIIGILKSFMGIKAGVSNLEVRLGTLEERELIDILKDLFNIKEEENLTSIRWRIREWIKNIGYPTWSLNYLPLNKEWIEKLTKGLYFLVVTPDKEIHEDGIKTLLELFKKYLHEFRLLLKKEKFKEGFESWLKNIESLNVTEENLVEILKYLKENMQEEIALWQEEKVELVLKEWEREKIRKQGKRNFISSLKKIFHIKDVENVLELREKIRGRIDKEIKYPLWIFCYSINLSYLSKTIKDIDFFVKSENEFNSAILGEYAKSLLIAEKILSVNLNEKVGKESFINWTKKMGENLKIDFIEFIRINLNKEVYRWSEEDLLKLIEKYKFIKTLETLFDFGKVNNLEELKGELLNWLEEGGFPFWAFLINVENEEVLNILNKILEIFKQNLIPPQEEAEELVKKINLYQKEIKNIFTKNNAEEGFRQWLTKEMKLRERDLEDIKAKTKHKMKKEEYYFNKEKVESFVHKFVIPEILSKDRKRKIIEKLNKSNKDAKEILLKLLDKYPEIYNWIEEFLE